MLAPMWEEAGGAREEERMLLKGEWRWETAENACREQGGHLASITTLKKQKSALRLFKRAMAFLHLAWRLRCPGRGQLVLVRQVAVVF